MCQASTLTLGSIRVPAKKRKSVKECLTCGKVLTRWPSPSAHQRTPVQLSVQQCIKSGAKGSCGTEDFHLASLSSRLSVY